MIHSAGATSEFRIAAPRVAPAAGLVPSAMVIASAIATLVAVLLSHDFAGVVATFLFGVVLAVAWVAPLRVPLFLVMFVSLAVDRPGDADQRWASPFQTFGGLLFQNLNKVIDVEALKFSGVFLLLACLLMVRGYRVLSGRAIDTAGALRPASPMNWGIVLGAMTIALILFEGWLLGGDIQMAKIQVQGYLQMLAVAYLFGISLRGPRDYRTAGKVIVAAACAKAAMALWVWFTVPATYANADGLMIEREYATNHGDSLLFAGAIAALAIPLLFRPRRRHLRWVLLTMPLILAGMYANDRRIAWVEAGIVLAALVGMNYRRLLTRPVARLAIAMSPLLLVYVIVGWSSSSRVFAPVHTMRGLVSETRTDGTVDRSTLYRDAENYNLVSTFRLNPVFGTGFGHPFDRVAFLDDISGGFREFAYLPHNSILGLWAFGGAVGFTGIFAVLVIAVYLAVRAHAHAVEPMQAIAATASVGVIGAHVLHAWGDIGFTEPNAIFLVGLAVALAGQTAYSSGAWPARWRREPASR